MRIVEISKMGQAKIELIPHVTLRPDNTKRATLKLTIRKGGLLIARGRSLRVTNVVPAQLIDGVGHTAGWIELVISCLVVTKLRKPTHRLTSQNQTISRRSAGRRRSRDLHYMLAIAR